MKIIVAADKNWGIGNKGKLLVSIPQDMKFFRATTTGHTVVMGRKTLESLPGGRPLPDRRNIVLTKNPDFNCDGVTILHSIDELMAVVGAESEKVFVIGGGAVYKELLPYCDTAYVTRLDYSYEADTYFPDLDSDDEWELTSEGEEETYYDLIYYFNVYSKRIR